MKFHSTQIFFLVHSFIVCEIFPPSASQFKSTHVQFLKSSALNKSIEFVYGGRKAFSTYSSLSSSRKTEELPSSADYNENFVGSLSYKKQNKDVENDSKNVRRNLESFTENHGDKPQREKAISNIKVLGFIRDPVPNFTVPKNVLHTLRSSKNVSKRNANFIAPDIQNQNSEIPERPEKIAFSVLDPNKVNFYVLNSTKLNNNSSISEDNNSTSDLEENAFDDHIFKFKEMEICILLNNESCKNWYSSLVYVIDLPKFVSTISPNFTETNISKTNFNETDFFSGETNMLTQNFNCIAYKTVALNISCFDVKVYTVGRYLPNDTLVLNISYSPEIYLLNPLFPHLKSLKSLVLSHNHHRYITKAFTGLENLEILDLSHNDIMVLSRGLSLVPRLRTLDLSNNQIRRLRTISNAVSYLENLQCLLLNHNVHIPFIEKDDLYSLNNCNISLLSLFNTTLQYIENGSFSSMPNLEKLELSVNYLNEEALANITCDISENVERLYFGQMLGLKTFPYTALNCLKNTKVRELYLGYNYFTDIPVLPNLPSLQILTLSNCSIKSIDDSAFENITNIELLNLKGNKITGLPASIASLKNLKTFYVDFQNSGSYDRFYIESYAFQNLTNLSILSISSTRILKLSRYCLFGLNSLIYASFFGAGLNEIEDYSFETVTSLEILDLRGNGIMLLTNFTFYGLNNLKHIYLIGNLINFYTSIYPFQFSPSISVILLQYNEIEGIPKGMFSNLEHLELLVLGRNKIIPWTENILHPNATIKMLVLSQNNIDYVSETMLAEFNQVTLYLDIGKNPFNCSKCGMKEFQEFCRKTNLTLQLTASEVEDNTYICLSPEVFRNKGFFELNLPNVSCLEFEAEILSILAIIFICIFLILIISMSIVCYTFRWYTRYWIFHLKTNFQSKKVSLSQKNFMYDAFIIYSSSDTMWVVSHLIPALESQEPRYRLCVHQRDFQVGREITENILDSIENSRKVILILTEDFIKSDWCMYELHLAQHKLFGDTRDILILVKLKAIDRKLYTKNISYIEKTRSSFMWTDSYIGQKLFWNQIRKQLGEPGEIVAEISSHI